MVKFILVYRIFVVLPQYLSVMRQFRKGIWKCPECAIHQIWKTRSKDGNKLDRRCVGCRKRVRVTLDRSPTGRGRLREVEIWERDHSVSMDDLEDEVGRRNRIFDEPGKQTRGSGEGTQAELPVIWGVGWKPEEALEFNTNLNSGVVRTQLLAFIAERHDGHLGAVAECWDESGAEGSFDGAGFHEFSIKLISEIENYLSERLIGPKLSSLGETEIIPMRKGELFLSRRNARFILDISLCLRRIAHYASVTLEQRIQWQRWMTRTRLVDE